MTTTYNLRFRGQPARELSYTPLISGMCDVLLEMACGSRLAVASSEVFTEDNKPAYPNRQDVIHAAHEQTLIDLQAIRAKHVAEWRKSWPGTEFGKAIIGKAIDGAIAEVREVLK